MKRLRKVIALLVTVALGAACGLFIRANVVGITAVTGSSMNDTLMQGDHVLVTKLDHITDTPERGDVVQLEIPGRDGAYLKRVVGLPGDTLELRSGSLYINGEAVYEPYATPSQDDFSIQLGNDEFFVLGDNRPVSYDSREEDFGVISAACFRGRVRAVLWPIDRIDFRLDR